MSGGYMNNRSKEESILREFKHLSEADLMIEIRNIIVNYVILTKSEEEASKILEKYDKKTCFDFNNWRKEKYYKLMLCAKLMNLFIPNEWYDVDITNDDIIERIIEFRNDEIKWVNENSYIYDGCLINDEESEFISLPSNIEINKIINFYFDIIEKEFDCKKNLIK